MTRRFFAITIVLCGIMLGMKAGADVIPPLDNVPFIESTSPAGAGSQAPSLSVGKGKAYLTWIEGSEGSSPVVRMSVNDGTDWSPPLTILSDPELVVSWADTPHLLPLDDGTLVLAWGRKVAKGESGYDMMLQLSKDQGVTWSTIASPYSTGGHGEHGFVSLMPHAGDGFWVVWLDGGHHIKSGGENTELRAARWRDGKFDASVRLDDRVCDCCQTAAALTLEGLAVAYRDRTAGEIRDISYVRFERGAWSKPITIRNDAWKIDGCPINGPALASTDRYLALAWYSGAQNADAVYLALSDSSSFGLSRIVKIDDGHPLGRVDVDWLPDNSALAIWMEQTGDATAELRARRVTLRGAMSPAKTIVKTTTGRASGFPQLAVRDVDIWVAWTDGSGPSTQVKLGKLDMSKAKADAGE